MVARTYLIKEMLASSWPPTQKTLLLLHPHSFPAAKTQVRFFPEVSYTQCCAALLSFQVALCVSVSV